MISGMLFVIILWLIHAPAWTYALAGVYITLSIVKAVRLEKSKKDFVELLKELNKTFAS
ncbi:MAG: hypothetical protein ACI4D6_04085 [Chordicoccus sp.]